MIPCWLPVVLFFFPNGHDLENLFMLLLAFAYLLGSYLDLGPFLNWDAWLLDIESWQFFVLGANEARALQMSPPMTSPVFLSSSQYPVRHQHL